MSKYYHTCPLCGANLDPGERCDCAAEAVKRVFGVLSPSRVAEENARKNREAFLDAFQKGLNKK